MGAITEFTRFDYYNALEARAYPVKRIFKMANRPKTIFIQMEGANPGWKVGQMISFKNAQAAFSGEIWYIYKGSGVYNLYVKHPKPGSVVPMKGGEVVAGSFRSKEEVPAVDYPADPFEPLGPDPAIEAPVKASMLPSFINQRTALIAAGVLVAFIVIRNI